MTKAAISETRTPLDAATSHTLLGMPIKMAFFSVAYGLHLVRPIGLYPKPGFFGGGGVNTRPGHTSPSRKLARVVSLHFELHLKQPCVYVPRLSIANYLPNSNFVRSNVFRPFLAGPLFMWRA